MLVSVSSGDKHAPEMEADKSHGCISYVSKCEILLELLGSTCQNPSLQCRDACLQIRCLGCILGRRWLHKIEPCVPEVEVG